MKVVYMGTPEYATWPLEKLLSEGHDIVGVYTQPDRQSGRGRQTTPPPVKVMAEREGLDVFQPKSFKGKGDLADLEKLKPDIIVVAAYGIILPPSALQIPVIGTLNIHPSLLPLYRGPTPVVTAILRGDPVTGVTIMEVDEGTDTGRVIVQQEEPIKDEDTTVELTRRLFKQGANLLAQQMTNYYEGKIKLFKQDDTKATYTEKLTKDSGAIDWSQPAINIWRQVKAYSPWPGAYTRWNNKRIKLLDVWPSDFNINPIAAIGKVVVDDTKRPYVCSVQTGHGLLTLRTIQMEGKQATDPESFVNGRPDFANANLA
ncbi:MAG: methionyl-tRNA formyltransferase [SAR202 cluster bacterium]|nr:methionyl-tRNA formyltransferase [SAR202 cluster bacterium]|tara:strand:- start:5976 stop:6920 length:945 start_codon:yes stop_codon:yes gene_type:complete